MYLLKHIFRIPLTYSQYRLKNVPNKCKLKIATRNWIDLVDIYRKENLIL